MRVVTVVVSCVCLLVGASAASAQSGPVNFGVKAGVTFANVSTETEGISVELSTRTGVTGGAFVEIPMGHRLFIQPEALVVMKGAELESSGVEAVTKLTYLDIPVLLRYNFTTKNSALVPYVIAGPTVGFLMSAKDKLSFAGSSEEEDVKDEMKSTEFGFAVGAGLQFRQFLVEGRFTRGLTNIADEDEFGEFEGSVKNQAFVIMGGIRF